MKKTQPAEMGSVAYSDKVMEDAAKKIAMAVDDLVLKSGPYGWPMPPAPPPAPLIPKIIRPIKVGPTMNNEMMIRLVRNLLPDPGEKYDWDVALEYSIPHDCHRLGLRLRSKYLMREEEDYVDIYSVHEIHHPEKFVSEFPYCEAVVDKLVSSIVRELARKQKEKYDVSSQS